ncbi:MAG: hypothetical protein U9N85_00260 [Bacteroidota bacterium]|nr:hypothetical protein [Bacteroidota bacterium]
MKTANYLRLSIVSFALFLMACPQPPSNPAEPFLEMQQLTLSDTIDGLDNIIKRLNFAFKLTDGDGNVGLKDEDTTGVFHPDSIFHYNCFAEMYRIENGDTSQINLNVPLQYRIPYLEPAGENKNLEAIVYINIDITLGNNPPDYDTVFYALYIYDRDFNQSNTISSPAVPFYSTGVYFPTQQ